MAWQRRTYRRPWRPTQRRVTINRRMPRRGRPMEVDDFDLVQQTLASSSGYSSMTPAYSITPVASLSSLLGSATTAQYSQMQAFKGLSIGRVKVTLDVLGVSNCAEQTVTDYIRFACALFIGKAVAADGTPAQNVLDLNPFLSGIHTGALENAKGPWPAAGNLLMDGVKWLLLKQRMLWCGNPQNAYACPWRITGRTRGWRIAEQDFLYYGTWWYASFGVPNANDVGIREILHLGVPRRFRT